MKYKIIKEYKEFYLCEHPNGYKECFDKIKYRPTEDGFIIKHHEPGIQMTKRGLPSEKVNKSFNYCKFM